LPIFAIYTVCEIARIVYLNEGIISCLNWQRPLIFPLEGDDIKTTVEKFWKREQQYEDKIILAEILIPDTVREECLTYLQQMKKITHGTLFPDYAGAVEICKIQLYEKG